jgi:hypothetical protein
MPPESGVQMQIVPATTPQFDNFKQFVIQYVQEHNNLEPNHQVILQIENSSTVEEIESYLKNHNYCDECFLKLYRKFATGEPQGCGCGM